MNIMTALQVKLTEGEQTQVYRRHTKSIEAYSLLLKAREHVYSQSKQGLLSIPQRTPQILFGFFRNPGSNRIEINIGQTVDKSLTIIHDHTLESLGAEESLPSITPVVNRENPCLISLRSLNVMKQKITLRIDKELIQKAKVISAQRQISISEMLSDKLRKNIQMEKDYKIAQHRAMNKLKEGFQLGKRVATSREDLHER